MVNLKNRLRVKETSWLYVLFCPDRWKEAFLYFKNKNKPVVGEAGDLPDPRDLHARLGKASYRVTVPEKFSLREKAIRFGWGLTKQSKNSCTAYSKGHGVEVTNTIEHGKAVFIDKEEQWGYQEATGGSRAHGDLIQNAEKQFHKHPQGLPQSQYRRLRRQENTVFGAKIWLLKNETIRSGIHWGWVKKIRNTNSGFMKQTGEFIPCDGQPSGGHAVCLTGWDDTRVNSDGTLGAFEAVESEKMKWGNNPLGVFWIKYSDFHNIFSKYLSRDTWDI